MGVEIGRGKIESESGGRMQSRLGKGGVATRVWHIQRVGLQHYLKLKWRQEVQVKSGDWFFRRRSPLVATIHHGPDV